MTRKRSRVRPAIGGAAPGGERLECRRLFAVGIDCGLVARTVSDRVLGVNVPSWDYHLSSDPGGGGVTPDARTVQLVRDAGLTLMRLSNGSGADEWHWASRHPDWPIGAGLLANLAAMAGTDALVNVNFGTGTPEEGAAYVAYLNGSAADTTPLGTDARGVDWRTVGFWAAVRGANPLATDDGFNHLRAGHPAAFGFHRFEIGNEAYFGGWRNWTMPAPGDYVTFARRFTALARAIDPAIQVGIGVGNPGEWDRDWNVPVLQACAAQGFTPGFLSDHFYVHDGNQETLSDAALLHHTVSDPSSTMPLHADSPRNWAGRARAYRGLLERHLGGAEAAKVSLFCAEFNSDADSATKQSTSLVKGLFLADALGSVLATEYQGVAYWNLRNHYETKPADSNHYGWRPGADEGMLGTSGTAPFTGPYVPYPAFFAEQLAAKVARAGGQVVGASSTNADLAVYAVKQANGHVTLLVVNKSATETITDTFNFTGFVPGGAATLWQYGKAEDAAQRDSATGAASLTQTTVSVPTGNSFSFSFPSYSMSVLDLAEPGTAPNPAAIFTDGFENGWTDAGSWLAGKTIEGGVLRLHGGNAWEALRLNPPATITPQAGDRLTFRAKGTGTWRVEGEVDGQDVVLGRDWASFSIPVTAFSTAPFSRLYVKNWAAGLDMDIDDIVLERQAGGGTAPAAPAPARFTVKEDTRAFLVWPKSIPAFTAVNAPVLTVTLSVQDGELAATGTAAVTVSGTPTQRAFTGSPSSLTAYFRTLGRIAYTPARDNTTARVLTTSVADGAAASVATSAIVIKPVNDRPTIAAAATVLGSLTQGAVEITYESLRAATSAADVEAPLPAILIRSVIAGSLQRWTGTAWATVSAAAPVNQRTILPGQRIRWIPPANGGGLREAFTIRAWDGVAASATCRVSVSLG